MEERAFKLFVKAWDSIKEGDFFDEKVNNTFDYMIKSLWNTSYKTAIKKDILINLPKVYKASRGIENPPPLFYILISLKDDDIIKEIQSLLLFDFIKSGAAEEPTFQILNFVETFADKNIQIEMFVNSLIKNINLNMNKEMVEALAHMITVRHPQFMRSFLKKFLDLAARDNSLLKTYVNMNGRRAMLELTQIAGPGEIGRIFKELKNA